MSRYGHACTRATREVDHVVPYVRKVGGPRSLVDAHGAAEDRGSTSSVGGRGLRALRLHAPTRAAERSLICACAVSDRRSRVGSGRVHTRGSVSKSLIGLFASCETLKPLVAGQKSHCFPSGFEEPTRGFEPRTPFVTNEVLAESLQMHRACLALAKKGPVSGPF